MAEYTVTWRVQVRADNAVHAAVECLEMQQDPFSEAIHFTVVNDETKKLTEVDLLTEEY